MSSDAYNDVVPEPTIFGATEKEIGKTISTALRMLGVPVEFSKIVDAHEEGMGVYILFDTDKYKKNEVFNDPNAEEPQAIDDHYMGLSDD